MNRAQREMEEVLTRVIGKKIVRVNSEHIQGLGYRLDSIELEDGSRLGLYIGGQPGSPQVAFVYVNVAQIPRADERAAS